MVVNIGGKHFHHHYHECSYVNMKILVENLNLPLRIIQTLFLVLGFWAPKTLNGYKKILFNVYGFFTYMFLTGTYIIIQIGDLYQVWGDVALMTGTIFLLFTNVALSTKVVNLCWRQEAIQGMIEEAQTELSAESRPEGKRFVYRCNRETNIQLYIYIAMSYITIVGWAISAEKDQLPMRAWYPFDTTKSPAYELTYAHQCIALVIAAWLNICMDTLVTSLISQCCCRFNLLSLSLRSICNTLDTEKGLLHEDSEALLNLRLRRCVEQHQAILHQTALLQKFFSVTVLGQFSVSMVIICVTAYQMAIAYESLFWFLSMVAYLGVMLIEVFIYCYHGNQLVIESGKVAGAIYDCPWYKCSPRQRKYLLLMMMRAQREVKLKAGNLTELSLATFMAIIKASYTFFTVLQRVEDGPME